MNKGLIGIQMSTIAAQIREIGVYEAFRKCAELGFHCIEVSQLPMTPENVAAMKQACADFGIKIAACSAAVAPMFPGAPGESLVNDFDKIVADCKTLGTDMLRIGMLPIPCMADFDKALAFAKQAEEMAVRLKEQGIDLYYHNHHVDFMKFDGKYLIDIIRENAPHLGFELDIHWIHRGGENEVEFINKYAGVIRLLHLKDYRIAQFVMPEDRSQFRNAFNSVVQFAEVGEGSLPVKACIEAGYAGGSRYFLIEQDDCYGRDPFDSLAISRDNLIKLGYADWFEL